MPGTASHPNDTLWGNGGGALEQGQLVDGGGANNGQLLNVVISAATGTATTDFGSSGGKALGRDPRLSALAF